MLFHSAGTLPAPPREVAGWKSALLLLTLTFTVWEVAAKAQEVGTISGTVLDASGAAVAGCQVTAVNLAIGLEHKTTTGAEGIFTIVSLPPGTYVVAAKADGFSVAILKGLVLHARDELKLTFNLEVGRVSETVEVRVDAAHVNTESPVVGMVVDREFLANMPLNGRSFQSLISLTPGVVITGASVGAGQFSMNGQRVDANYFMVDGVSANVGISSLGSQGAQGGGSGVQTSATGGYNNIVSVDAVQEFKIETSTFAPEYGRLPGGQVSIVTRSGSNHFHGGVFEYLRNTVLDANNWFNNRNRLARPPERQNDFGGVLGGPIWKNKVFFFFSYEAQRLDVPTTQTGVTVPSVAARQRAVPAMQPILNAYPVPTAQCAAGSLNCDPNVGTLNVAFSNRIVTDAASLRLDWSATGKMTLFARGNDAPSHAISRNQPPSNYILTQIGLKTLTFGQTYTLRPTVTSDLRFNYTYAPSNTLSLLDNFGGAVPIPDSAIFTVPGYSFANSGWAFSGARIVGLSVQATGTDHARQYNIIENVSWMRGKHQMKFGIDFRKIHPYAAPCCSFAQNYLFSLTTDSWVNNVPALFIAINMQPKDFWYYNTGVYAEDTWRISPRLTVTYGLRWDVNPPPGASTGHHLQALNQIDGSNLAGTHVLPEGATAYRTEWSAFAPRIGLAYQLSQNPKWGRIIRGGYGLFYDTGGVAAGASFLQFASAVTPNPGPFPVSGALAVPPKPATAAPWGFVSTVDPRFRLPYTHQWSAAVEQSLGSVQSLTVTYAAALGKNLPRRDQYGAINSDFPQGFFAIGNESYSNYHSMQALFQRRLSQGLQAMAAYTWAHSTDTSSSQVGTNAINTFFEPVSDYHGNSDFDIRHSFQTAITYSVPRPGANKLADAVLGHWGVDTIFRARTAPPIELVQSNAYLAAGMPFLPGTTTTNPAGFKMPIRPFTVAGVPFFIDDPNAPGGRRLNPAAFVTLPANTVSPTQGTLGRNFLRGFGWNQVDLALRREFPIYESWKLQFRADFFNLLNHPAFFYSTAFFGSNPLDIIQSTFGSANGTLNNSLGGMAIVAQGQSSLFQVGGPRSVQFSLKLVF